MTGRWSAFYTEAEPCESCGMPTYLPREWNAEYELWIAVDCSCSAPAAPICPALLPVFEREHITVGELSALVKEHRKSCARCGGVVEMPKREHGQEREAA